MIKEFLLKKMVQSKLKDVPPEMQDKLLAVVQKNPDFFMKIASEVQAEIKSGKTEMNAAMEVMGRYKEELAKLMQ